MAAAGERTEVVPVVSPASHAATVFTPATVFQGAFTPEVVLALQRTAGNQAVSRYLHGTAPAIDPDRHTHTQLMNAPRAVTPTLARVVRGGDEAWARRYSVQIMSGNAAAALNAFRALASWDQDDSAIALMRLLNDHTSDAAQMAAALGTASAWDQLGASEHGRALLREMAAALTDADERPWRDAALRHAAIYDRRAADAEAAQVERERRLPSPATPATAAGRSGDEHGRFLDGFIDLNVEALSGPQAENAATHLRAAAHAGALSRLPPQEARIVAAQTGVLATRLSELAERDERARRAAAEFERTTPRIYAGGLASPFAGLRAIRDMGPFGLIALYASLLSGHDIHTAISAGSSMAIFDQGLQFAGSAAQQRAAVQSVGSAGAAHPVAQDVAGAGGPATPPRPGRGVTTAEPHARAASPPVPPQHATTASGSAGPMPPTAPPAPPVTAIGGLASQFRGHAPANDNAGGPRPPARPVAVGDPEHLTAASAHTSSEQPVANAIHGGEATTDRPRAGPRSDRDRRGENFERRQQDRGRERRRGGAPDTGNQPAPMDTLVVEDDGTMTINRARADVTNTPDAYESRDAALAALRGQWNLPDATADTRSGEPANRENDASHPGEHIPVTSQGRYAGNLHSQRVASPQGEQTVWTYNVKPWVRAR